MKRFSIFLFAALFSGAMFTSCSGNHKACAAYAKHELPDQPTYSDVQ